MTTDAPAVASPPPVAEQARATLVRIGVQLAFSERTPLVVAALGVSLVLCLAGSVLVAQRLEEVALLRHPQPIDPHSPAPIPRPQAPDFTLAPGEMRAISADQARAFNAGVPFSTLPILAAKPFLPSADRLEDYARALECLTAAIYHEAASETAEGQAGVAQVVLNRVRHPAYPNTVCGVVFQGSTRSTGCQFTFTCDGALARTPSVEGWARARAVASAALNGSVAAGVGMATHYHADWVAPYWAERLVKVRQIGSHIFYRWAGTWGLPSAFTGRYGEAEPLIAQMATLSAPVEALDVVTKAPMTLEAVDPILLKVAATLVETPTENADPLALDIAAPVVALATVAVPAAPPRPSAMASPLSPAPAGPPPRRRSRIATPF